MSTTTKPGDSAPIILSQAVMRRMEITPDDSLDTHEHELRIELGEALRYTLRAAIRMTVIKRAYFDGKGATFVAWVEEHVGVGRRMAYQYVSAGRCLMAHADRFDDLAKCPLAILEQLGKLTGDQMRAFLSSHAKPEEMDVDQVKAAIAGYLGKECTPSALSESAPKPRQLVLPGLDELEAAPVADPWEEWRYAGAHLKRFERAYNEHAAEVTTEQLQAMQRFLGATLHQVGAELRFRQAGESALELVNDTLPELPPAPTDVVDVDGLDIAGMLASAGSIGG